MASYIYMKILESKPERYDRGISMLSLGQAGRVKKSIAQNFAGPDLDVLEIGAGTAELALLFARQGARVCGIDQSAGMLEIARKKVEASGLAEKIELLELGVAEMDRAFADESFDLVVSTLVFSELSRDEQTYALKQANRVLKAGGKLVLADEVRPAKAWQKLVYSVVRIPLLLVTYLITQTTTRPVAGLPQKISDAGFVIDNVSQPGLGSFMLIQAHKPVRA